ncbi:MAG: hypothetical protein QNJ72_06310 [Pleurocapsa sp. MO_226.B13]|nr:hypothetical protein [Pleurocapsa sp. MO_226.B13]
MKRKSLIKVTFSLILALVLVITTAIVAPQVALAIGNNQDLQNDHYTQLSSALDQVPPTGEKMAVKFEQNGGSSDLDLTPNSVIVRKSGLYLAIAAPQVTASMDGGCLDLWLNVSGDDVSNSNTQLCQTKAGDTNVILSQNILRLEKGDTLQLIASSPNNGAFLDAIEVPDEPLIPSIIFTMVEQ